MNTTDRKARLFQERENEILETARQLFIEKGVGAVTIEMISDAVGIGKGTIYKHFKTKDDLFTAIYLEHAEQMFQKMSQIDPNLSVVEKLRTMLRIVMRETLGNFKESRVFHDCLSNANQSLLSESTLKHLHEHHEGKVKIFDVVLQEGVDQGVFREDVPVAYMTLTGHGMLEGIQSILSQGAKIEQMETLFDFVEDILIRGILKK